MSIFRPLSCVLVAAASSIAAFAPTPAAAWSINVTGASCSPPTVDGSGNITINCSGGTTNPSCTVSPSTLTIPASGGTVSLSATCGAATSGWSSSRAGAPGGTQLSYLDSLSANTSSSPLTYTYTFTGANGTATATVTQQAGGTSTPPTDPNSISCSSISGIKTTKVIDLSWKYVGGVISTRGSGGFGPNEAMVFVVKVPAGANSRGMLGSINISPSDAAAYNDRLMSLSDTPCDFSAKLGRTSVMKGQEPVIYFTVGGYPVDRYGRPSTLNANLDGGKTYYITVLQKSIVDGANTCMNTQCNIDYKLLPPQGT
jgi:hypothetical protein